MQTVERISTMQAAAASSINDELTVILSGSQMGLLGLPECHPVRNLLLDIQQAAIRLAWENSGLLSCAKRNGGKPTAASLSALNQLP